MNRIRQIGRRSVRWCTAVTLAGVLAGAAIAPGSRPDPPWVAPAGTADDFAEGLAGDEAALGRAIENSKRLLEANPDDANIAAWHGYGLTVQCGRFFEEGKSREGIEMWSRGLELINRSIDRDPGLVVARLFRARSAYETSRHDPDPQRSGDAARQAAEDLETVLGAWPADAALPDPDWKRTDLHGWLADVYEKLGDKERAKAHREKSGRPAKAEGAPAQGPPSSVVRLVLAVLDDDLTRSIAADMAQGDEAAMGRVRQQLDKREAEAPGDATLLAWRAMVDMQSANRLFRTGKPADGLRLWEQGLKTFDRAAQADPVAGAPRLMRGLVLTESAGYNPMPEESARDARRAVTDLEQFMTLGEKRLAQVEPGVRSEVRLWLGRAYRLAGEARKARETLQGVLDSNPDAALKARCEKELGRVAK